MSATGTAADSKPATFAHSADVALDRDASVTVELHFQPPSSSPKPTEWLLLHTIPVTASLTTVLTRLLEAQTAIVAVEKQQQRLEELGSHNESASSEAPGLAALASESGAPPPVIELVRVGYVISEIHAYCLLLKCRTASCAAALKATLERGAALGIATPVEFVLDGLVVLRLRRSVGSSSGVNTLASHDEDGEDGTERQEEDTAFASPGVLHTEVRLPLSHAALYGVGGGDASTTLAPYMAECEEGSNPLMASVAPPSTNTPSSASRRRQTAQQQRAGGGTSSGSGSPRQAPVAGSTVVVTSPVTTTTTPSPFADEATPPPQHTPLMLPSSGAAGTETPQPGPSLLPGNVSCCLGLAEEHCPICQVEPLAAHPCVVTLCYHVYHLSCYAKLTSAECPLCRFSLYNLLSDARCEGCGTYEDLWACLICGYVGCGRGRRNHTRAHYEETGHSCTLQCSTNRVWNESSRMFLNQEVALVLGELDVAQAGAKGNGSSGRGGGGGGSALGGDNLWQMTQKELDAHDAELQAALAESRDEAVHQYYAGALHALIEEQRAWYARGEKALLDAVVARRERRHRRATREDNAAAAAAVSTPTQDKQAEQPAAGPDVAALVSAIVREEQVARRDVAAAYVEGVRQSLTQLVLATRGDISRQRARQEELREVVLLQSHRNTGLQSSIARLHQRIAEAQAKGTKDIEAKRAKVAALEQQVADALSRLTA